MTYVSAKNPPLYVGGFVEVLPVSRPATTTGRMRWPTEGLGSRRNLIRSCAIRLQADYEESRAAWRQVHPARGRVDRP